MNITYTGKDFQVTPSLKEYAQEKLGKLARFNKQIERIDVEMDVAHGRHSGDIYRVEVWVHTPGKVVKAGEKTSDMHAAIDLVYPKLERQLVRLKDEMLRRRKTEGGTDSLEKLDR